MELVANHPGCYEFHAVEAEHLRKLQPFLELCLERENLEEDKENFEGVVLVNLGDRYGFRFLGTSADQVKAIRKIFDEAIAQVVIVPQYQKSRLDEYQSGGLEPENAPVFNFTIIDGVYIGVDFRHLGADNTIECALKLLENLFADEGVINV